MSVETILNTPTPITFKLQTSTIEVLVHELTIQEASTFSARLRARARQAWLGRLKEISQCLPDPAEQRKLLAEAARQEPDLEDEIQKAGFSPDGIKMAIQMGTKPEITDQQYLELGAIQDNAAELLRAMQIVLGIQPEAQSDPNPDSRLVKA